MSIEKSPLSPLKFYKLHESQRNIIAAGEGWYQWSLGRWRVIPVDIIPPELRDKSATPPMRGARWFTQRQLDLMGVKVQ